MNGPMTQCPADSPLMKAWEHYKATDDYRNSLHWATELAAVGTRERYASGSLWAAFVAGFGAAGGKTVF